MAPFSDTRKLTALIAADTFVWLVVYVPLETYVTLCPILTALAVVGMVGSLVLVFRAQIVR